MRISPLVILTSLVVAACGEASIQGSASETDTGTSSGTETATSGTPPTAGGDAGKRPDFIGTCHALAADGDIVKRNWPDFYVARE